MIITAITASVILADIAAAFAASSDNSFPAATTDKPAGTPCAEQINTRLMSPSVAGAHALGSDDDAVAIVESGDCQCTRCVRFHEAAKVKLIADFIGTGNVRLLFKDFPINDLSDTASSLSAAESYYPADQGKYREYFDKI